MDIKKTLNQNIFLKIFQYLLKFKQNLKRNLLKLQFVLVILKVSSRSMYQLHFHLIEINLYKYNRAFLVAKTVKNLLPMQKTGV